MKKLLAIAAIAAASWPALGQNSKITVEDWLGGRFYQYSVYGIRPMNDGESYTTMRRGVISKTSYQTGDNLGTVAYLPSGTDDYEFSADEKKIIYRTNEEPIYRRSFYADYYIYDIATRHTDTLYSAAPQRMATLSPDCNKAAFILDNNIILKDLATGQLTSVTTDGKFNKIINGVPDWVYEEEFEFNKAYEFSPDGRYIAYIKFNEENVKSYTLQYFSGMTEEYDPEANYPVNYVYKYPKAGESNSIVSVHVYDIMTGKTHQADLGTNTDIYIPRIEWINQGDLCICKMNRLQNHLELLKLSSANWQTSKFFEDKDPKYIEEDVMQHIRFINGGREFIIMSEQSGSRQLYHYNIGGQLINKITSDPRHEVLEPIGYSEADKRVYYKAVGEKSTQEAIYSVGINGKKTTKLSLMDGTNDAEFSQGMKYFINFYSSATTPRYITVCDNKGKELRILQDNAQLKTIIQKYGMAQKEFFEFYNSIHDTLNAYIMKPADFDSSKKYPVLVVGYNGPNHCEVNDQFEYNWHQILAQKGYIVACIDTRGTGRKGSNFRKCTYGQLGKLETEDLADFAKWLRKQKYVDPNRLGIWGWSYGGFMVSNLMTRAAGSYNLGIAIAPVENWEYYDNIYTERYMGLPQQNHKGYTDNSPLKYANQLKGKLLLIYGSADDNVHPQNAMVFAEALVQANKEFDMAVYTNKNHGIYGGNTSRHLYNKIIKYIEDNL